MKQKADKSPDAFHFRGQMYNEEIIEFFRRHWLVILPQLIPFTLYITGLIVFAFYISRFRLPSLVEPFFQFLVLLGVIGTALFIHRFFLKMIEYFLKIVIITNYRLVDVNKTLFIHDDKHSIVMKRMQDIQKQQKGIIKSLLKVGELIIIISFADPRPIRNVPHPDYHFRLLNQIRTQIFDRAHRPLTAEDEADLAVQEDADLDLKEGRVTEKELPDGDSDDQRADVEIEDATKVIE